MIMKRNLTFLLLLLVFSTQILFGEIQTGNEAPLFSLPDVNNEYVALRDLCGEKLRKPWKNKTKHVVVLSFFASWCKPCIAEIPHLQVLKNKYKNESIKFFLINVGEEKEKIQEFLKSQDITIQILMDKYKKVSEKYDALRLPRLIVIDQKGVIQLEQRGFKDGKKFEADLDAVISKLLNG